MQDIILEEPYEFVPPIESDAWCWLIRFYLKRFLRTEYALHSFETRHVERLRASLDEGKSVILAPNHSRLSDPVVLGILSAEAGTELFAMASWHLFKETWWQTFMIRRMGAFSIYREGNDRQTVSYAIEKLVEGRRPLIIFPEGALSRHNDLMMDVMDGPAFIARQAAKKREKAGKPGVVIHPVAIRYRFDGDLASTVEPELRDFEEGFSWQPQTHLTIPERIGQIAEALLCLKEIEYLGAAREGNAHERAKRLMTEVLDELETKWETKGKENGIVARIKAIRMEILPDMIEKKVTPEDREARWRDLAKCYYLQQIAHYPPGYVSGAEGLPERIVETVERMQEDFHDRVHYHGPMHCTMMVGDAIEVSPKRDRNAERDPAMQETHDSLQAMLTQMAEERRAANL